MRPPQHREIEQLPGYPAAHVAEWIDADRFVPRFNVAPRSLAPVLRRADPAAGSDAAAAPALVLHTMKWGLVPSWMKHEDTSLSTTNARSEGLVDGGGMWARCASARAAAAR